MEIKAKLARLEKNISRKARPRRGDICSCDYPLVIVDFGDGVENCDYPPRHGDICPKCGKRYTGPEPALIVFDR